MDNSTKEAWDKFFTEHPTATKVVFGAIFVVVMFWLVSGSDIKPNVQSDTYAEPCDYSGFQTGC